ncbi:NEDD4 family-interacting protein 1 [Daphnia magna]|uniref:NEDD4 family-interacting protein n=1 Tax=Daphnia magna TaxID=35525 RepID=A0A0P6EHE1_9CRUS|nr:NEDD4 family-interacting protein 1 [Daphnia magna]KZS06322.1 NEDD4 family-interacting protein 1 [Daphnia magna]
MERNMAALTTTSSCQGAHGTAEAIEPLLAPSDDPPPFTLTVIDEGLGQVLGNGAGPSKTEDMEPPAYDVAIKLPTYEEAQQEKMIAEQQHRYPHSVDPRLAPPGPGNYNFMSPFSHPVGAESQFDSNTAELALGTDVYFFASFLIAFLFNWIGFLLLMCACHTVAGRYGALAGFGLSLAKWTLIVKHSTDLASNDNNWLWWLIMAFGVLICVRAVIQYLCIKREWHRLSRAAQERVVFFY